jgi:hypothetical protein
MKLAGKKNKPINSFFNMRRRRMHTKARTHASRGF